MLINIHKIDNFQTIPSTTLQRKLKSNETNLHTKDIQEEYFQLY